MCLVFVSMTSYILGYGPLSRMLSIEVSRAYALCAADLLGGVSGSWKA